MAGDEPILLYASDASQYSLLAWRAETSTESNYIAVPGQDRRRDIRLNKAQESGEMDIRFEEELNRGGGVWTRVEQAQGRFTIVTRRSPSRSYSPPTRFVILSPGGKVDIRPLSDERVMLGSAEYALLPVDLASEQQLEQWIEGLKGLPADLRDATLQSIVNGGLLDFGKRLAPGESATGAGSRPAWMWMLLTGIIGLVLGAAGDYAWRSHPKVPPPAQPPATAQQASNSSESEPDKVMGDAMRRLENALAQSKRENVRTLVENHVGPFAKETKSSPARRTAEAWMLVKLVMMNRGVPVDAASSKASNQKAREFLDMGFADLSAPERNALLAALCNAGETQTAPTRDAKNCTDIDWDSAPKTLDALAQAMTVFSENPPTKAPPTPAKKTDAKTDVKTDAGKAAPKAAPANQQPPKSEPPKSEPNQKAAPPEENK
jgi:hypothetical protein